MPHLSMSTFVCFTIISRSAILQQYKQIESIYPWKHCHFIKHIYEQVQLLASFYSTNPIYNPTHPPFGLLSRLLQKIRDRLLLQELGAGSCLFSITSSGFSLILFARLHYYSFFALQFSIPSYFIPILLLTEMVKSYCLLDMSGSSVFANRPRILG